MKSFVDQLDAAIQQAEEHLATVAGSSCVSMPCSGAGPAYMYCAMSFCNTSKSIIVSQTKDEKLQQMPLRQAPMPMLLDLAKLIPDLSKLSQAKSIELAPVIESTVAAIHASIQ